MQEGLFILEIEIKGNSVNWMHRKDGFNGLGWSTLVEIRFSLSHSRF